MTAQKKPKNPKDTPPDTGKTPEPNQAAPKNGVLIIDDERQVRETIRDILEMEAVPAFLAADGEAGIAAFIANQNQIGLIILDLYMPGLSGLETFAALRELDPSAKIVLSSGYSKAESLEKLENFKPTDFLPKPYRLQTILHLVAEHLA